jgi:hypothetical protein
MTDRYCSQSKYNNNQTKSFFAKSHKQTLLKSFKNIYIINLFFLIIFL